MHSDLAKAALLLLARADLKGAEARVFMQVWAALEELANPQPLPEATPTSDPQ